MIYSICLTTYGISHLGDSLVLCGLLRHPDALFERADLPLPLGQLGDPQLVNFVSNPLHLQ